MTARIHAVGKTLGRGYCGARAEHLAPNGQANCPNCAAALAADAEVKQIREKKQ